MFSLVRVTERLVFAPEKEERGTRKRWSGRGANYNPPMAFVWDDFAVDVASRRLSGPEGDIHVEPQVFDVLACLIEQRDRVISKAEILDTVWGDQFVSESALSTRIKQVRQALGDDGRTQKYVRSVHGRGYQFVGEITSTPGPAPADRSALEPDGAPASVPLPEPMPLQVALDIAVDTEYPFVGRADELTQGRAMLEQGRQSNTQIFIGGAPGAGKSRLAVQLLDESAADGAFVCAGRCEAETTSGLQAVRDAFAQLAAVHPDRVAAWAEGVEGPLLSLMPSLVNRLRAEPVAVDAYAGIDVFMAVFERITADGPMVLLVDDLQWSDDPTRTFLGRLHRRLRGRAITTITTHRSGRGQLPPAVHQWVQQQRRASHVADIRLEDLTESDAGELIAAVMDQDEELQSELMAVTGGHCLFLTESLREVQLNQGQSTSDSVVELIAARLDRQTDNVRRIVEVGAVLGTEFPFQIAAAASELDPTDALTAIDEAIEAELLHETSSSSRFRFSHQLVPQAINESLSKPQRAALHHACASALLENGADAAEVAFHRLGAIPLISVEDAVASAQAAAAQAEASNQFDLAIRLLERVVAIEPDTRTLTETLLAIGQLINSKGMPGEAIPSLDRVVANARLNGWPDLLVDAALAYWSQSPYRKPRDRTAPALLEEANELLGDTVSVKKAHVLAKMAVFNVFVDPLAKKDAATAEALRMAEQAGADAHDRLTLLEARHIVFSCPAGADELDVLDPEMEELRLLTDDYFKDAAAPETAAFMRGRGAELRRVTEGDADRMAAQPIVEWRNLVIESTLAAFDGEIAEARELCDRASEIGEIYWGESAYSLQGYGHFFYDLLSGDWSRSFEMMDLLVAFDGSPVFLPGLALTAHHVGDMDKLDEMRERLRPARWGELSEHIIGGNALVAAAELALVLDDDALADGAEKALAPYHGLVMGVPWSAASLAAADPLARLAARRGDHVAAAKYRDTARSLYEGLEAPALVERLERLAVE